MRSGLGSWAEPPASVGLNMTPFEPAGTLSARRFITSYTSVPLPQSVISVSRIQRKELPAEKIDTAEV